MAATGCTVSTFGAFSSAMLPVERSSRWKVTPWSAQCSSTHSTSFEKPRDRRYAPHLHAMLEKDSLTSRTVTPVTSAFWCRRRYSLPTALRHRTDE